MCAAAESRLLLSFPPSPPPHPSLHRTQARERGASSGPRCRAASLKGVQSRPPPSGRRAPSCAELGAAFGRIVRFNRSVFGPFYAPVLRKLLFPPGEAGTGEGEAGTGEGEAGTGEGEAETGEDSR
ncbi:T-complex protein 11-like protein 2 [Liparis tanakae]|uniref:T-complex protein 11-like protein 2 n=1 Tax=Liparis tanakae TaxID=230148 RepID=A0A4Z2G2R2_9TELE|nr:T-complex protein 11-like protein 2 [Liparis tanakae]